MSKLVKVMPSSLKPYVSLGLDIDVRSDSTHVNGDCPFCGRSKFTINVEKDGVWRCLVCAEGTEKGGGNIYTFIHLLHVKSMEATKDSDYTTLAAERKLLFGSTLRKWGVCKSILTDRWLVPGYNVSGKLCQLYSYTKDKETGRNILLATAGLNQQLHGVNLFDHKCEQVDICEGPWDGMAWWETLSYSKKDDEGNVVLTNNPEVSQIKGRSVIATPGCSVFTEQWAKLLDNRKACFYYDNDHPRKHPTTDKHIPPAGYQGMMRACQTLSVCETPPKEVYYLCWGGKDKDHDAKLPSGYDVRDYLSASGSMIKERGAAASKLMSLCLPIPTEWVQGGKQGSVEMKLLQCTEWSNLVNHWRKALKWTVGLEHALACMLASTISTRALGDQLWFKIIGPAGCGKSTLCEALSTNSQYVFANSHMRGFHSGWKSDSEGKEDNSLITKILNKTLVTKDGDTLLKSPNRDQILAEARDLYDGDTRIEYRNKVARRYHNARMSWILCGTGSLRQLDKSELGARFLDCVIMESIDLEMEDDVLWRVANRTDRVVAMESDGSRETQYEPDLVKAMQLTGGYVGYLRRNAKALLGNTTTPPDKLRQCVQMGKFVSYMRARPSTHQAEHEEREFGARLVIQLVKLSKCLAAVLNKKVVDDEVMARVHRVAMDTARGRTINICRYLYDAGEDGLALGSISGMTGHPEDQEKNLLRFMRKLGATEIYKKKYGESTRVMWRLSAHMRKLYHDVAAKSVGSIT